MSSKKNSIFIGSLSENVSLKLDCLRFQCYDATICDFLGSLCFYFCKVTS